MIYLSELNILFYIICRICLGRNAVMRKALGATIESEHKTGTSFIASKLEGDVGLLFTNEEAKVVTEWFETYQVPDFARAGNEATEDFVLPAGMMCNHSSGTVLQAYVCLGRQVQS